MIASDRFREIFKNVQNIVPESLDNKIFEAGEENKTESTKKTPFEIIKEFILDMLNIKNQGDFAKYESDAMKKYFGINVKPETLSSEKPANLEKPKMDPSSVQENSFVWEGTQQTSFSDGDRGCLFAFPITRSNAVPHEIIFIQPISLQPGGLVEVRFTFDHQALVTLEGQDAKYSPAPTLANIFDWSCNTATGESRSNVYYGLMRNDITLVGTILMCWVPCQNSSRNIPLPPIEHGRIAKSAPHTIRMNNGQTAPVYPAKLSYYDSQKQKSYPKISFNSIKINRERDVEILREWSNALQELRNHGGTNGQRYWT
jgi:hypothetical protein